MTSSVDAALLRERHYLLGLAADWISFEMAKQPLIIIDGELQPREIPDLPENFREALRLNAEALTKLSQSVSRPLLGSR